MFNYSSDYKFLIHLGQFVNYTKWLLYETNVTVSIDWNGQAVAASFCFSNPPKVNLNIDNNASKARKKMRRVDGSRFSANNPYGRMHGGDNDTQIVRH